MVKIMLIHHTSMIGGGSICLADIIDMLNDNYDVVTYCPSNPIDLKEYIEKKGQTVKTFDIPIPMFNHYSGGSSIFSWTFWRGLFNYKYKKEWKELILSEKPDIVIVNSSVLSLLGPIIKESRAKGVLFNRETFVEKFPTLRTRIMLYFMEKWFDVVLFISKYDKYYANLKIPISGVVADCLNNNNFYRIDRTNACENLGVSKNTINLLFVGGVSRIKGLEILLDSLEYLDDLNITLMIAGYSVKREFTKKSIKDLFTNILHLKSVCYLHRIQKKINNGVKANRIKVLGKMDNLSKAYSAADILIFPSTVPHQARPAFEAGAYECPVVISDYKQTREYVKNNYNGLVFKPKSAKELAKVIRILYFKSDLRRELGINNKYMTQKLHNFDFEKEKLLDILDNLVSK